MAAGINIQQTGYFYYLIQMLLFILHHHHHHVHLFEVDKRN